MPILKEAESALDSVDKNELNTLKSYQKVVAPIEVTMKALCVMKGINPIKKKEGMQTIEDWWATAKKHLLNNIDALMKEVKSFGVDKIAKIDAKTIEKLKAFFSLPEFEEKTVARASASAASLSKWIRVVVAVYEAYLIVDPKQKELKRAETALAEAEAILAEKKAELQKVLDKIAELESDYEKTKKEKEDLEAKVEKCKLQIDRATKLTEGLAGEKVMWKKRAEDLRNDSKSITGDIMLSSGIIAYLGAFPILYRDECIAAWKGLLDKHKILRTENYSLQDIVGDGVQIGNWTSKFKLPND
jgi:dynein heavy chain